MPIPHDKLRRLLANSSLSAMGAKVGLGPSTLRWLLDNERPLSRELLTAMAREIGVPPSFLLDDSERFPVLVNPPTNELRRRKTSAA